MNIIRRVVNNPSSDILTAYPADSELSMMMDDYDYVIAQSIGQERSFRFFLLRMIQPMKADNLQPRFSKIS
jgi:hypothetical protein